MNTKSKEKENFDFLKSDSHFSDCHFFRGFTLVEIIVAMLILSLVMAGMTGVFVAGKKWVMHSRERMIGSEIGRLFMDPLQKEVRQDTWANWDINVPLEYRAEQVVNGKIFTPAYKVADQFDGRDLRKVTATITWGE